MTAIAASIFSLFIIFLATTIGSSFVFFFRKSFGDKTNNLILGFASGIMISASFFGLLLPSIDKSKEYFGNLYVFPVVLGFLFGGVLLYLMDRFIPHLHKMNGVEEGRKSPIGNNMKFFLAVTMHNIPEGLSVGFACGLALHGGDEGLIYSCLSLACGIAIQNIPEGAAVSIPMFGDGMKKGKAFLFGVVSGIVEPIFGIIGLFISQFSILTPWLLSLACGAMIYVTLDELLPEARKGGYEHYGIWAFMAGFVLMMTLEMVL
jgi:zinc transporter, ZIP family